MKHKIFLISMVMLPALAMFGGCGSDGGYGGRYNPNEIHIYHHDDSNPWLDQARIMQNFSDNTDDTMDSFMQGAHKMNRDSRDTFGIINDAQKQDELYRQQRRQQQFGR